mgnify:CR=1 FL=1
MYSESVNGLKRRYEYRETKRKMRCIFCIREWSKKTIRIQRDEEEDKIDVYSVSVRWSEKTIRIQRDEEEDEVSALYP